MAKRQIQFTKTCSDCIHESACRIWTDGRFISDASASVCPNHETVKESGAYLCGVLDERKRRQTNADRIRAMSDEEITEFVCRNGINTLCDIICGGECNAIASFKKSGDEACKQIVMKWLQQPSEVDYD